MNKNKIIEPQEKNCILIVEDNADMRELLAQLLEEENIYDLHFAENGLQVIEQAIQLQPDLILMDMSLPGISGWEIVPNLRRLPTFSQTPIIAVTAHVSQADHDHALAVGSTAYLGKPFDITEILEIIARLLAESTPGRVRTKEA
jgi:two-component system cell cycle response regulator DivK